MCGICGIVDYAGRLGETGDRERLVQGMLVRMRHRGPDGSGMLSQGVATLGAVRLAIQDRAHGKQPLCTADHALTAVFNGEVYNHEALRAELGREGYPFVTRCDTEVLLALVALRGEAAHDAMRGMFAYAVWDRGRERLSLARDRCGEKPLVYWHGGGLFAFASEINALLALPFVRRRPNRLGLHYGLHYVHVPAPYTAFEDLHKLPPAHAMKVDRSGLAMRRYWTLRFETRYAEGDRAACVRDLAQMLDETVALVGHCPEVKRGAFLSGGLDSSSVVACLARSERGLPTFRAGVAGVASEEQAAAREMAERYDTVHTDIPLQRECLRGVRELVSAYAEPTGTMVALDAHELARGASRTVSVALSGSGADEIFGGYEDALACMDLDRRRDQWAHLRVFCDAATGREALPEDLRRLAAEMAALERTDISRLYADTLLNRPRAFAARIYSPE